MTMTANCQTGPCSMYTQCATSGDCPGGGTCTPSPLSASEHYCVGGGAEGGTTAEAGGHDGGTTEGGGTETGAPESGTPETGSSDAGGG
jgi:hypothetical protein